MQTRPRLIWRLVLCAGLALISARGSIAAAQEPASKEAPKACWTPRYLCLCAPYCDKPPPCPPCWSYRTACETYCRKPAPCLNTPCIQYQCDTYQCKPLPCYFPKGPCPPCIDCRK